jgi:hypothetical protein
MNVFNRIGGAYDSDEVKRQYREYSFKDVSQSLLVRGQLRSIKRESIPSFFMECANDITEAKSLKRDQAFLKLVEDGVLIVRPAVSDFIV